MSGISIELRLRSLEAKQAVKHGVFVVEVMEDGTAEVTIDGKTIVYKSQEMAGKELHRICPEGLVIVWVDV